MKLPIVTGSNLNRQKLTFPADFAGRVNLVFIAFQQWQQNDVDGWVPLARRLEQEFDGFRYYEFPTIHRMNLLGRTFLNEGMRAGIPDPDTRARTVTLYLDKRGFRQDLDIPNENHIWLYLFDRHGHALWRVEGAYTSERGAELEKAVVSAFSEKERTTT